MSSSLDDGEVRRIVENAFQGRKKNWMHGGAIRRELDKAGAEDSYAMVGKLVDEGFLAPAGRGFRLAESTGLVRAHVDVLSDDTAWLRLKEDGGKDIRIPLQNLPNTVMHGDVVEVELNEDPGQMPRIDRIIHREPISFEGTLEKRGRNIFVSPDDPLAARRIWVNPDHVGNATEGDRVRAKILALDLKDTRPEAVIEEVVATESPLETALKQIVDEYNLRTVFPPEVLSQVESLPEATYEGTKGLLDLRKETLVTIDGKSAQDYDDAIGVQQTEEGYLVTVAIADVARYVGEGTKLDQEAYRRATSVYFPGLVYPMLPERLSNDLCSLVPKQDRPVMGVRMWFDENGFRLDAELFRGWIRSKARMTYSQVSSYLEDGEQQQVKEVPKSVRKMLHQLQALTEQRIRRRHERGALDFDLPEPEFVLGMYGEVSEILHFRRRLAHRAIEELMIAANEAVAELLAHAGLPILYRCHAPPSAEKYDQFRKFAHHLGLQMPPTPTPEAFQKVALAVEGTPFEKSVHVLLLRTMSQAEYRLDNIGHFGLSLDHYAHFTSPIRRYPDLVNHRWAIRFLERGGVSRKRVDEIREQATKMAEHITERERGSEQSERDYIKVLKARFMEGRAGERFQGVISGVAHFGLFVELSEYLVEGLVSVRDLGSDYFIYEEQRMELVGKRTRTRFRLGDMVEVELVRTNVEKGHIDFRLVKHHPLSYGRTLEQAQTRG